MICHGKSPAMISIEHVPDDEPLPGTSPLRREEERPMPESRDESRHAFAPHPLKATHFVDHLI